MVTQQVLVLFFQVRILVVQPKKERGCVGRHSPSFSFRNCCVFFQQTSPSFSLLSRKYVVTLHEIWKVWTRNNSSDNPADINDINGNALLPSHGKSDAFSLYARCRKLEDLRFFLALPEKNIFQTGEKRLMDELPPSLGMNLVQPAVDLP